MIPLIYLDDLLDGIPDGPEVEDRLAQRLGLPDRYALPRLLLVPEEVLGGVLGDGSRETP